MNNVEQKLTKTNRKFQEFSFFSLGDGYNLLPFKFHRLSDEKEVLVNEVGDHIVAPFGTVEKIINRQLCKVKDLELYGDLCANYFITEKHIPDSLEILATRYRTKKAFLDFFTSLHIFVISLRCEHTCHYCQVSRVSEDKSAFDMDNEYIDKGIQFMMKSPNPFVTMEFQGGEALLAFDTIVYAVERTKTEAKKYNKTVTYVICTNLAVITDEMLYYCKDNDILISTSLDGPSFIHNKNRHRPQNNSYELAIEGINRSREILGFDKVSALLTTTALSLNYPNEIVEEYYSRGFRNIFLRPISPYGFATKNENKNKYSTKEFLNFYKIALARIIDYNLEGIFFKEDYTSIILKKILTPFHVNYVDLQSPAGMINNVIVFNYDGKIYATDESRMLAEMKDFTFQLGDFNNDTYNDIFYGRKAYEIAENWSNECLPGCSECAFQSYCGADPVLNHATQGDLVGYRPTNAFCERNMEIIRYLIELMDSNTEIMKVFNSWLK